MKSKTKKIYLIFIFGIVFFSLCFPLLPISYAQDESEGAKNFEGTMTCKDEDVITDEQWQWYKCVVDVGKDVNVYLSYTGDLDLDLRLYWKRDNNDDFNGFDLTHCSSDNFNYSDNSQLRTENTDDLGETEELYFTNPSYVKLKDQEAYILVFVFSGKGKSEYVLESNIEMTIIADENVYHCIPISLILLLFMVAAGVIFAGYVFVIKHKKKKLTRGPKEKEQKPEEAQDKKKVIDLNTKL